MMENQQLREENERLKALLAELGATGGNAGAALLQGFGEEQAAGQQQQRQQMEVEELEEEEDEQGLGQLVQRASGVPLPADDGRNVSAGGARNRSKGARTSPSPQQQKGGGHASGQQAEGRKDK